MEGSVSNPYIISLDKINHNFLTGTNWNIKHETVPLWSNTNYDDYYEFEIRASRIFKDEVPLTYKCHICNVSVPVSYFKEHNESTKHKTYRKIADIALQRVQFFITESNESDTSDANYNTYFCAPCSTAVPLRDRESHEAMKQHTNSLKQDKMLKDFLTLYINDVNSDEFINVVNNFINNEDVEAKTDTETVLYCESIEILAVNGSIINVPFNNYHGYFKIGKHIQCRICKKLIDDKDKMVHMLSEEHKKKAMMPIKDGHCIRKSDDIWSHCILCNEIIMDEQFHKLSSTHNDKLNVALVSNTEKSPSHKSNKKKNKEENLAIAKSMHHCVTCNRYMPECDVKFHIEGKQHKSKEKQKTAPTKSESSDKLYLFKSNDKLELSCRVCLLMVDNIDTHMTTDEHISKYNDLLVTNTLTQCGDQFHCEICNVYMMESYVVYHTSIRNHKSLINKRNSALPCTKPSLGLSISKSSNFGISASLDALPTTSQSNKGVESNKGVKSNKDVESNKSVESNKAVKSHKDPESNKDFKSNKDLESNKDLKSIKSVKSINDVNSNKKLPTTSKSKNNELLSNSKSENNITLNPKLKLTPEKKNGNLKAISEPNIDATSKLDITACENTQDNRFEKLFEVFSKSNQGQSKSESESSYETTEMGQSETSTASGDRNSDTYHLADSNMNTSISNDSSYYLCFICNVAVTNQESIISEHVNGNEHKMQEKAHKTNTVDNHEDKADSSVSNINKTGPISKENVSNNDIVMKKVEEDTIQNIIDSNKGNISYYCTICETNVPNHKSNIREHINGSRHNTIQSINDNKSNKIENINSNNKNNPSDTNIETFKVHYHCKIIDIHYLFCLVCRKFVTSTLIDMNAHIKSFLHMEKYKKVLEFNRIKLMDDKKYVCDYCKVEFTQNNEISHIMGRQHVGNANISQSIDNGEGDQQQSEFKKVKSRKRHKKTLHDIALN